MKTAVEPEAVDSFCTIVSIPTCGASLHHLETPSPHTEYGIKGVGEGGAIPPPATIFNAVNDALRGLGVEMKRTPRTPRRILAAIAVAEPRQAGDSAL